MTWAAHLFATLITLPCLLLIVRLVRRGELRSKYAMIWMSVGVGMVALAAWPSLLDKFADVVGIAYGPTALFLVAVLLLMLLAVHFSWELSRLEERTRVLAEELALARAGVDPVRPQGDATAVGDLDAELSALVDAGALDAAQARRLSERAAAQVAPVPTSR